MGNVRELGSGRYLAETGEIIDTTGLPASAQVQLNPAWGPIARNLAGAGFAFSISAAFQWFEDTTPYLTAEQRMFRASVSGVGGIAAWGAVSWVAYSLGASAWAGPIGIAVGAGITFVWIKWVQPVIFDYAGVNPQRNLSPLQFQQN